MDGLPLAVSMGDPAGIGPEIIAKAWYSERTGNPAQAAFVVCGDPAVLARYVPVTEVGGPEAAMGVFATALPVLPGRAAGPQLVPGKADPCHASATLHAIERAVALALSGQASGVVTAPIAKQPLYEAGFDLPGHTEFLARLTADAPVRGPRGPVMMLAGGGLRVALATIHTPLRAVADAISEDGLVQLASLVDHALREDFALSAPRLTVAGLNPHAGEGGGIGREEVDIIAPAVARMRALGLTVTGPASADTLFHAEARARHDAVLCMYHDQGLIPLKMLAFWDGVNVTLGLPVVRTSPDHGTGFDIAGTGKARPDSFLAALALARTIASNRARYASTQP